MNEQVEQEQQVNEIDYKAFYEEHKETVSKLPGLLNKQKELLAETKAAKEERRKIEEATKIEQQKNGQFEHLWKQEKEEKEKILNQLLQDRQERKKEKIDLVATKLAVDLAKGDANKAELLSVFIADSINKLVDDSGVVEPEVLEAVKKQFEANAKFAPLLGGNLSVGGSAPGNMRGAQTQVKEMLQNEFLSLNPMKQMEFIRNGGVVNPNK